MNKAPNKKSVRRPSARRIGFARQLPACHVRCPHTSLVLVALVAVVAVVAVVAIFFGRDFRGGVEFGGAQIDVTAQKQSLGHAEGRP